MKRSKRKTNRSFLMCALVLFITLMGCGETNHAQQTGITQGEKPSATPIVSKTDEDRKPTNGLPTPTAEPLTPTAELPTPTPSLTVIEVRSTEELLEHILPGANLLVAPGVYNMSEFLDTLDVDAWNESHAYVKLRECFDGVEVVVQNVDGLSIVSDNEHLTELVVEPRYATVLNFESCNDLFLMGLTMGHTLMGDCSGSVLGFASCRNISLSAMDLYGCGVYGIYATDGTGDLYVYSSTIRDCEYGPLWIGDGARDGDIEFRSCSLTGSNGSGYCDEESGLRLAFYGCVFGDNETSYYMFRNNTITEDCIFSEHFIYPEYAPSEWTGAFEPDKMEEIQLDETVLYGTALTGYCIVNMENGETLMLPEELPDGTYRNYYFLFDADGTGTVESRDGEQLQTADMTWGKEEDGMSVWIRYDDGRTYYLRCWRMEEEESDWYSLFLEDYIFWLN